MNRYSSAGFLAALLALVLTASACTNAAGPQSQANSTLRADTLLYQRAFEVALWAMPATDSFATREAVRRDLKGEPNDIVINTRPMDSDISLVALQTQTPYLQGAIDLSNGPVVVEIPPATGESHLYGVISDAWQRPLEDIDVGLDGWDQGKGAKYLLLPPGYVGTHPPLRHRRWRQHLAGRPPARSSQAHPPAQAQDAATEELSAGTPGRRSPGSAHRFGRFPYIFHLVQGFGPAEMPDD